MIFKNYKMCCCNSLEKKIKKIQQKLVKLERAKMRMKMRMKDLEDEIENVEKIEDDLNKKLIYLKLERQ